jgi:HD superfamily phosphodiesterase
MTPFPRQLAWFTAALFGAFVLVTAALLVRYPAPEMNALIVFGALMVFSFNGAVRLANNVAISPIFMVMMAAIVVFDDGYAYGGVALVAACGALYRPHFSKASWPWMPFNAGLNGLGAVAAALVYAPLAVHSSTPIGTAIAVVLAMVVLHTVNVAVLLSSYLAEQRHIPREVWTSAPRSVLEETPFAVVGYVLGWMYLALGPAVMVLIIVPILIAREMFGSYMRVKESHEDTVGMLIHALEQKDHYTAGHAGRVANYAHYVGEELNFMPARLERLRFAALMHDIGKLVVPNHLLNKPGRLTAEEFARVRAHEKVSVQMLSHIDFLRPIADSGHSDNTRFNPDDPDHPIEPYIVMIADAYDAMTSTRAYRKALSQEVAFQELRDKAGIQFHPACVEALIGAIERRGEKHGAGHEGQPEFVDAPATGVGSAGLGDLMPSEAV